MGARMSPSCYTFAMNSLVADFLFEVQTSGREELLDLFLHDARRTEAMERVYAAIAARGMQNKHMESVRQLELILSDKGFYFGDWEARVLGDAMAAMMVCGELSDEDYDVLITPWDQKFQD